MFTKTLFGVLVSILCLAPNFAQTIAEKKPSPEDEKVQLEKQAVAFIRETIADVNAMRSPENRITFSAEMASLMWFHDEKEARAMYLSVIAEFRNLMTRYNNELNELAIDPDDMEPGPGGFASFMMEPTASSRIAKKFRAAAAVRQQIAASIAEHDPDLAFAFYNESQIAVSNPEFRKQLEAGDDYFEMQLIGQIADNNPAKAVKFASKSLEDGVEHQHIEILRKLYTKDPDKGVEFGAAMLGKLKSSASDKGGMFILGSLIEFGSDNLEASGKAASKRPVYTRAELRDLADILGGKILNSSDEEFGEGFGYLEYVKKYSPARAAQIQAKFKTTVARQSNYNHIQNAMNTIANAANAAVNVASSNSNSAGYELAMRQREEREKAEQKVMEDIQSLTSKQLSKDERGRVIAQSRKIVLQMSGRDKKVAALSMLAAQVMKLGDKDLALSIMKDAEALVSPAPKNYQDFLLTWMLTSGYAPTDPDKAFVLLEEAIWRANDTLEAFVKVGEFIDVAEEIVQDGEVQVGAFGGGVVRGLSKELGMAEATIQVLAKADFDKTKNLTNRFGRPEVRVLAKMMVLRAVLKPNQPVPSAEVEKKSDKL
jgi:hypothetical protein